MFHVSCPTWFMIIRTPCAFVGLRRRSTTASLSRSLTGKDAPSTMFFSSVSRSLQSYYCYYSVSWKQQCASHSHRVHIRHSALGHTRIIFHPEGSCRRNPRVSEFPSRRIHWRASVPAQHVTQQCRMRRNMYYENDVLYAEREPTAQYCATFHHGQRANANCQHSSVQNRTLILNVL